jgi:hypothetical protein
MSRAATLHLISGLPGAGKSTYAENLKAERDAAHLSLDWWLITLFGRYSIESAGIAEHGRRVYACRDVMWSVASEFLQHGTDVILDDGFFRRADRARFIDAARDLGAEAAIHFLDTPAPLLRARLAARNRAPGLHHFEITPATLEVCIAVYEPPALDEAPEIITVRAQ